MSISGRLLEASFSYKWCKITCEWLRGNGGKKVRSDESQDYVQGSSGMWSVEARVVNNKG
jgi:hypothetical protein